MPKLSQKLGRYVSPKSGNSYLWTKRQAAKPNKISQEIKNLEPCKLYSLKLVAADYPNIAGGKVEKKRLTTSIDIDNVVILPEKTVLSDVNIIGKAWLNYHRLIFRAKGPTARLTISDWKDDKTPGGPIAQEILYNFIEVQPYIED